MATLDRLPEMNENCLEDGRKINIEEIKEAGRRHAKTLREDRIVFCFGIVVCESMQRNVRVHFYRGLVHPKLKVDF